MTSVLLFGNQQCNTLRKSVRVQLSELWGWISIVSNNQGLILSHDGLMISGRNPKPSWRTIWLFCFRTIWYFSYLYRVSEHIFASSSKFDKKQRWQMGIWSATFSVNVAQEFLELNSVKLLSFSQIYINRSFIKMEIIRFCSGQS